VQDADMLFLFEQSPRRTLPAETVLRIGTFALEGLTIT